ncbi:hypothetical protein LO762_28740 [Actinocorallia sp. API 0066]|uniref:hypothetical protein n=1 Tax=Actinocorallia sp. API 0066 TaxID=2896846 RepID=UPI001E3EC47E|nr:hypothetical protein [Actinocorallia sp. API 0066]MCD0453139.1 hypothetical protein [Actinocorallia sp. API 0066]
MRAVTWSGALVLAGGVLVGAAPATATGATHLSVGIEAWGDARPGGLLDYLVTVTNHTGATKKNLRLDVSVPRAIEVIGLPDGCREAKGVVRCGVGSLSGHAVRKVTVSGIVKPTAKGAQTAVAQVGDASARATVKIAPGTDLAVRLRTPQGTDGRRPFRVTARVLNKGKKTARKVTLTVAVRNARLVKVPKGCTARARRVTCNAAALEPGAMVRWTFRVRPAGTRAVDVFATVAAQRTGETFPEDNGAFGSVPVVRF